jgi:hypothetical protein
MVLGFKIGKKDGVVKSEATQAVFINSRLIEGLK